MSPIKQTNTQIPYRPTTDFQTVLGPCSIPSRFTMTSTTCPRHLSTGSILSSELSAVQSKQHNLTPSTTIAALLLLSSQFFLITVGWNTWSTYWETKHTFSVTLKPFLELVNRAKNLCKKLSTYNISIILSKQNIGKNRGWPRSRIPTLDRSMLFYTNG